MQIFLTSVAVIANVLGASMALPQARHLARTRCVDGISASWVGVSVALNAWWFAYGIAAGVWALIPVSGISLALYVTIAVLLVKALGRRSLIGIGVGAFGLGMVPLPALLLGGWTAAGVAIGLSYGIQLFPAVVAAFRTRALTGIAPATWILAFVEALLWLVYGTGIADMALAVSGAVGAVLAGAILVRLAVTGHRPMRSLAWRRRLAVTG
jgi:uncharacterized protein with PQ loop repeat